MKKAIAVFFISSLLIPGLSFSFAFASTAVGRDASSGKQITAEVSQMAQDFTSSAMSEFESIDDTQLSYAEISSKVQEYSQNFSKALLDSGVELKTSGMIMHEASVWYGRALEALFNGKDYNQVIQEYSAKIADLFNQQHLGVELQSNIVAMTSDNLESVNFLFQSREETP